VPIYDVRSLADRLDQNVAPRRLLVILLSIFAGIALLLAVLGVYGVMTFLVAGRMREIGLRRALGAGTRDIVRLVMRRALPIIVAGALGGVALSLSLKSALAPMLFGVSAADATTIALVATLLTFTALLACCIPLRKALHIDPIKVLYRE
jgi:ABC-type antimicrobial peptide transport system permease subunit